MSKVNNLILFGKEAYSASKIAQLKANFQKNNSQLSLDELTANEIYLISGSQLDEVSHELQSILDATDKGYDFDLLIGPRAGTISPWSSKAQDIVKNVRVNNIDRLEKFIAISIGKENLDSDLSCFYDRMTQAVYESLDECKEFLQSTDARKLLTIDILGKGKSELEKANNEMGFAMSQDEIDYLDNFYKSAKRNPTDAELMMFAQANSEHCRHKIFNAKWNINGANVNDSLFDLIKATSKNSPQGIISAYKDNAAIIEGGDAERIHLENNEYVFKEDKINSTIKVETHNHPTAISPYPGAATGSGGEIRDEGATGKGAKPKLGIVGFNVSNLRIPGLERSWEGKEHKPERIASPLDIMIEAPIGAAAFNNEFGRPSTLGYFRVLETQFKDNKAFGFHKPIMLAGGIGEIRDTNNFKEVIDADYLVVVLGGPAMLIGLGGGAASSVSSGESDLELDFASVQRDNAEMERRCQEVINTCSMMDSSLIEFIHDVGAGGLSNAIPELAKDSDLGVEIDLNKIPIADPSMSPMEIWSNESQERYVLAIHPNNKNAFIEICNRERCEFAIVGTTTKEKSVKLYDPVAKNYPVDVPLSMLFGDLPITEITISNDKVTAVSEDQIEDDDVLANLHNILQHPTVASKSFLITIGDRTVSGMIARDQFIGPYQVPVSNYSASLRSYKGYAGEAVAIGEKANLAINNPGASMRMALGELLTNLSGIKINGLDSIQVSANWMAPTSTEGENSNLREGVEALSKLAVALNISIPVGKDSLSMKTKWSDYEVASPLSGTLTGMSPVSDVRNAITPEIINIQDSTILHIALNDKSRLGGSIYDSIYDLGNTSTPDVDNTEALKSLFNITQSNLDKRKLLALHDVSDGGLLISLTEMAFASKCGLDINLENINNLKNYLFAEEIGILIQVKNNDLAEVINSYAEKGLLVNQLGNISDSCNLTLSSAGKLIFTEEVSKLEKSWREVSHAIQSIRDNKACADSELALLDDNNYKGLYSNTQFNETSFSPFNISSTSPKVAILREQGVNGQLEMAAAFSAAGFKTVDVHMQDLLDQNINLSDFNGLAACGGFSYGDVLGAGGGWAKTILHNQRVKDEFQEFFNKTNTFTLGVCNGCQMLSHLKELIPGAEHWPAFKKNLSDQFEARLVQVQIQNSNSKLLANMDGWSIPVASAHGEGRAVFNNSSDMDTLKANDQISLQFIHSQDQPTETYPLNPNGSPEGITGITSQDGRVTIMMPHPERVFRSIQMSWQDESWKDYSPWMQMFINAKDFSDNS